MEPARTGAACVLDQPKARIRELNDALRREMTGGQWLLTPGVIALGQEAIMAAIKAVQSFDAFTPDNDPYGEHDFGSVQVEGETLFWKMDYLDNDREYASPDPSNADLTERILTLMLASEY